MILNSEFYMREAKNVAHDLLGKTLVVLDNTGNKMSGIINETEAYHGYNDDACHGYKGITPRCKSLYLKGSYVYVYFTYGMHYMLNIVTHREGFPSAVLVRSIIPMEGINIMAANRYGKDYSSLTTQQQKNLSNGPGKLTKALKIDKFYDGKSLSIANNIWIEESKTPLRRKVKKTPRIGIDYAVKSKEWEWRFLLEEA